MAKVRTLFIGTGDFAVPILKHLLRNLNYEVVAVVTQPDRPAGRDQSLQASPVKEFLQHENSTCDLIQPEKLSVVSDELTKKYEPELIVVASYGQILPNDLLVYPKFKCVNFHGSLLPKLRGAVPVPMAILEGFKETGVSMQVMVKGLDEGAVIASREVKLDGSETSESLMSDLSSLAGAMVDEELIAWIEGKLVAVEQDHAQATYCYRDDSAKAKAQITFKTDVQQAERMVRAFNSWPVAWIELNDGRRLKIFKALLSQASHESASKLTLQVKDKKLFLVLSNGVLELQEVQLEGRKRGNSKEYLYLGA